MAEEKKARWYAVSVHSAFENRVADEIKDLAEKAGVSPLVENVLVPKEDIVQVKRGVKVNSERKFFPGYILVKMVLTDETWYLVHNIPKVKGFLGGKKPSPMAQSEVDRILNQVQESIEKPKVTLTFEIGETIKVCDGPFSSFAGVVEEVDSEKTRLKVSVSIFGRATPVDLDFVQVEKV